MVNDEDRPIAGPDNHNVYEWVEMIRGKTHLIYSATVVIEEPQL